MPAGKHLARRTPPAATAGKFAHTHFLLDGGGVFGNESHPLAWLYYGLTQKPIWRGPWGSHLFHFLELLTISIIFKQICAWFDRIFKSIFLKACKKFNIFLIFLIYGCHHTFPYQLGIQKLHKKCPPAWMASARRRRPDPWDLWRPGRKKGWPIEPKGNLSLLGQAAS